MTSKMYPYKVGTLNTRGGGKKTDRLVKTLVSCGNDVTCLQEMHVVSDTVRKEIERRCDGKLHVNDGTSQSRGVATFVRNRPGTDSKTVCKDNSGRILGIEIKLGDVIWTIYNVYAPNDTCYRAEFFHELSRLMEDSKGRIIITGDFNCTLDRYLDRTNSESKGAVRADRSRRVLSDIMKTYGLVDVYRRLNPVGVAHTFTGPNGYRARLDRLYTDQVSVESAGEVAVQAISYSDHDLVSVKFGDDKQQEKWGRGRWILNTKLLFDPITREELSGCIQYCKSTKAWYPNILVWWDSLKEKVREVFISNGKRIKRENRRELRMLETELNELISMSNPTNIDADRIRKVKNRLEEIEKEKAEGVRIRSKEEWIDKRENCARYFYEEERRKGKLKVMESVLDEGGKIVTSKEDICRTIKRFYEKLLTMEDLDEDKMERLVHTYVQRCLSDEERDSVEGIITKDEIMIALKGMKNNKSPGLDGLPREFYVVMWHELGNELSDVIANICLMDQLPESWTEGLVTTMFKEKGDIRDLKNWRPLTLLNTDYKIMTKALANRMRKVSPHLVSPDQSCGLKDRFLHDQLYFIRDFIQYFNETSKTGLTISIDQEKCFDRIDHRLIHVILKKYNFGPTMRSLIRTIYQDMKSRVLVNGLITEPFRVSRSVRQGDGLSMSLAVLVGELLGEMLKKNMEIVPICLPNSVPKCVAQYADDTSIITSNVKCLNSLWKTLRRYENVTGARVNEAKTEIMLVGKWTPKKRKEIPERYRMLVKDSVRILGVIFGKNAQAQNEDNIMVKIDNELEKWRDRNLSMRGKIAILRTLVTSKIWHVAKVTALRQKFISQLTSKMSSFFWYPKTHHPVSVQILQNDIDHGGQNFPNVALELSAYFAETLSLAVKYPEKEWVGMLRYRHGRLLEGILPGRKTVEIGTKQSVTSTIVDKALRKLKVKPIDWQKMEYSKLLTRLRENVQVGGTPRQWRNMRNSSRVYKRADLNYLIAHNRLPLASFLHKKGIARNDKCRLCNQEPETHQHLFYQCQCIQNVKQMLFDACKNNSRQAKSDVIVTFDLLTWHTPKPPQVLNELLSNFKQCIWLTRAAVYYDGVKDVRSHLKSLYVSNIYKTT